MRLLMQHHTCWAQHSVDECQAMTVICAGRHESVGPDAGGDHGGHVLRHDRLRRQAHPLHPRERAYLCRWPGRPRVMHWDNCRRHISLLLDCKIVASRQIWSTCCAPTPPWLLPTLCLSIAPCLAADREARRDKYCRRRSLHPLQQHEHQNIAGQRVTGARRSRRRCSCSRRWAPAASRRSRPSSGWTARSTCSCPSSSP